MTTTYLKLLQLFESFASAHLQVKRFKSDFTEQLQNFGTEDEKYPILYVTPEPSTFNTNDFTDLSTYTFRVYALDIIQKDRANINNILNNTSLILNDLHKWLKDGEIEGIDVLTVSSIIPVNNYTLDYVAGWQMTISIEVETYSVCEIPFKDSPIISVYECDITYNTWQGPPGPPGPSGSQGVPGPSGSQGPPGPGAVPGGNDTEIQFNSGSQFAGDPLFTWDYSVGSLNHGTGNSVPGILAYAQGASNDAIGEGSHAEGSRTSAQGIFSHAEGSRSTALGDLSHAEGNATQAQGEASHAEGDSTIAEGDYSHAEGNATLATGKGSHAEGDSTVSQGQYSHAEGVETSARAVGSHAEGYRTSAKNLQSHAEGIETTTESPYSHAEGDNTITFGIAAHSEGAFTTASGDHSHAEGSLTKAIGAHSHAEGLGTQAHGSGSHAEGWGTYASGAYQHVQGQYNAISTAQSAFIIGNGTSIFTRRNLVFASGSTFQITGSLQVTGSTNIIGPLVNNTLTYPLADNGEFSFIQSDGNGNLSLQYVNTIYETVYNAEATQILKGTPLYVSGSQGANSRVFRADAGDPSKMPVTYIAADNINPNNTGRGIVLGLITGVNTTGYPGGTEIYVAVGGGWTSTRPTGSAIIQVLGIVTKEGPGGQGLVLNPGPANLPNLTSGSVWVGNSDSIPVTVPTASLSVASASYALTASYALNGGGGGGVTIIKKENITFASSSWVSASLYEYLYTDSDIASSSSIVDFTPNTASLTTVISAIIYPTVVVTAGSASFYAANQPSADITGELVITNI